MVIHIDESNWYTKIIHINMYGLSNVNLIIEIILLNHHYVMWFPFAARAEKRSYYISHTFVFWPLSISLKNMLYIMLYLTPTPPFVFRHCQFYRKLISTPWSYYLSLSPIQREPATTLYLATNTFFDFQTLFITKIIKFNILYTTYFYNL
jgi:hypothetical protein